MTYDEIVADLAPLETLPIEAFKPSKGVPQNVCDLILAFALAYNDFRDVSAAHFLLKGVRPENVPRISRESGHFGGLFIAVLRLQAGVVFELLHLVRRREQVIRHPVFRRLVGELDEQAQRNWRSIEAAAFDRAKRDKLAQALHELRNSISFHYGFEELRRGLENYLAVDSSRLLFVSRGGALKHARFYFADAAAEQALIERMGQKEVKKFFEFKGVLIEGVNRFLYQAVTHFVEFRGFSYALHRPSAEPFIPADGRT